MTAPDGGPDNRPAADPLLAVLDEVHDLADGHAAHERQLADLAGEVDAIVREADPDDEDDKGGRLARLDAAVLALAAQLEDLAARQARIRVPVWVDMDREAAAKAWEGLETWIGQVLLPRYDPAGSVLPPCWYRHPQLVEELTWLWTCWEYAYRNKTAPPTLAAEWHTRSWPHVRDLLSKQSTNCRSGHRDRTYNDPVIADDRFAEFQAADLASRPTSTDG